MRFQNHYSMETDITGTKKWIDGGRTHDNASEVTLTLYRSASGSVADAEKVAGATPTWDGNKYTFANQPISDRSGNGYVYWVIEDRVEGYDVPQHTYRDGVATSVPGAPNGGLITNELSQDYVEITVTKQWDDASDQDGKRPDDLTLALYRTGKEGDETYTQKVNWVTPEVSKSGNDWTYTFKNQLKYDSQRYEFIYEVREETVPDGYTRTYCDVYGHPLLSSATGARNRGIIKNTHTPETTTITGTKTWDDGDNRDGKRPASITVNLLADDTKVDSATVTPDASGAWAFSFSDKPVYKNGAEIVYTVEEEAVEGYTAEVRNFDITNTHAPERVSISGTKEWKHAEGGDADPTVDSFTVKLQKSTDGTTWTDVASKTVAARTTDPSVAPNAWTFENQYKYEGGVELKYRCIESPAVAGWVATEGTEGNGYKITNTTSQEQISFSVKEVWEDNNNAAGKRPASVKVGLYRYDSSVAGGYAFVKEIELSAASNWQTTVTANKYHNGVEARYSVRELSALADGYYQRMVSGSAVEGFEVENYRPERTISGQKVWSVPTGVDAGLFPKPESITVYLQKKVGDAWETVETKTVPTSGTGADTWTFSNVAQIDSQTKENIEYRVAEEPVPGWTVSLEGTAANNYNIVNVLDNPTTVRLVKTWDDNNNAGGLRPGTEAFANGGYLKLLRDGVDTGLKPTVIYLSSSPNIYTVTWTIPASDTATYTVEESPVPGYKAGTITGSGTSAEPYRLTNTLSTTISGTKTWPDDETVKMGWTVPDSITVKLQKKDSDAWTDVESKTVSKDASTGKWTYTFEGLPKYADGTEIEYRVVEAPVAGFKASGGTATDNYNLTNEYDERTITLTKTWAGDGTAPTDTRPNEIMFPLYLQLYRDDVLWNLGAPTPTVADNGDNTYTVTYVVPRADENGNEYEYRIEETDIQNYAEGTITGSMEAGYAVTNTYEPPEPSAVDISVSMNYENGPWADWWGPQIGWGGIVKGGQVVTITNTETGNVSTLTFTPVKGGGMSAAQTIQLTEGTYTISQTAYTPEGLDAKVDGADPFTEMYLMRTIDQTITIDSSGECTLSTSGNQPGDCFYAQYFGRTTAENPETGDFDIPVFEPTPTFDQTGRTSEHTGSCVVSGDSITLKSVLAYGDLELADV